MRKYAVSLAVLGLVNLLLPSPAVALTITCPNGSGSGDVCVCVDGNPSCSAVARRPGDSPGATLLLPFFEVDLGPSGVTTLVSINNASANAVLAHAVLWSDLAVPVLDFNLYLTGYDQQSLNLADIIVRGLLPQTASAGQDPTDTISPKGQFSQDINFASCAGFLPAPTLPAAFLSHVQTSLTGRFSALLGGCAGLAHGDNIARGYMTVDTVSNCTLRVPGDAGYFAAGGSGDAVNQNVLWGDYSYLDPAANRADGETLVSIEADGADPATSTPGQYTFYGRYVNWTAADNRKPLATNFGARYFAGGSYNTYYLTWRDSKVQQKTFQCGTVPGWYPLAQEQVVIFDEQEHPQIPQTAAISPAPPGFLSPFGAAAQKTKAGSTALPLPYSFGWTFLNLNTKVAPAGLVPPADPAATQAWVEVLTDLQARFYLGFDAVKLDSAGKANHALVGQLAGRAFHTLPPCRLVDTRNPDGPLGGPALQPVAVRTFQLAGACGVPSDAIALALNISVTQPAAPGFLRIYPGDIGLPLASQINFSAGQTRTNNAILAAPVSATAGTIVRNDTPGPVHLILDVSGYFQ